MTDSKHSSSTPSERRRRLEPVLRHVLATLPPGAAYSTAQLAAMLAPRLPEQAAYLSTDLVALANALPGLCVHSDPELQTVGVNKGRMIRRKTWHRPAHPAPAFNREQSRLLREPLRDWRDVPSLQEVVLDHFVGAPTVHDIAADKAAHIEEMRIAGLARAQAQTGAVVPDALTDALKRIDRLERLLISFGYQLPPLKD